MADLFGITLIHNNLWLGMNGLRQRWLLHFDNARTRPILQVDEAQEVLNAVLTEMRLLTSAEFDSRAIFSVVLAGDMGTSAKNADAEAPSGSSHASRPQRVTATMSAPVWMRTGNGASSWNRDPYPDRAACSRHVAR